MGEEAPALLGKCAASTAPKTFFVLLRLGLGERARGNTAPAPGEGSWCNGGSEYCEAEMFCYRPEMSPTTRSWCERKGKGLSWKRELDWLQHLPKQLKKRDKWQEQGGIINIFKSHAHNVQMGLEGRCWIFKKSFNSQNIRCTFFLFPFNFFFSPSSSN